MSAPAEGALWAGVLSALLLAAGPAAAQTCARDVDCPGEDVCEQRRCVTPRPPARACKADLDCRGGELCRVGFCVPYQEVAPAPPGPGSRPAQPSPAAPPVAPVRPPGATSEPEPERSTEPVRRPDTASEPAQEAEPTRQTDAASEPEAESSLPVEPTPKVAWPRFRTTLSWVPVHLVVGAVKVKSEWRITDWLSGAGAFALGAPEGHFPYLEVAAQVAFYPLGSFDHGMQAGAQLIYFLNDTREMIAPNFAVAFPRSSGLLAGPFIGYKLSLPFGLTFDAQGGFTLSTAPFQPVAPFVALAVGWSFLEVPRGGASR